ncbi:MAG: hypothetical protein EBZ36_12095 [Acidobacteria bacterium]|nr:hypothetical protein [Acidobacteriota bacterium]
MAATATERPGNRATGGDGGDNRGDGGRGPEIEPERTPPPEGYRIGMWLAILSAAILFISLNVLYSYNNAGRKAIIMPRILWISTGLILLSSLTIEYARRSLRQRREDRFRYLLGATLLLGVTFLAAQLLAWQGLQSAGFYLNRNFRSSFAYIFTALHGLHLIGGLGGLFYLLLRRPATWTRLRRRVSVDVTAIYWHFLSGLWLYLWVLIFVW